jgi:hypothetical protein
MQFALETDEFGRLACSLSDGQTNAVITTSEFPKGSADLLLALDTVERRGKSECYWREGAGEYRWVLRKDGDRLIVAVMWSTGTLTGWEHAFWTECDHQQFASAARAELNRITANARL